MKPPRISPWKRGPHPLRHRSPTTRHSVPQLCVPHGSIGVHQGSLPPERSPRPGSCCATHRVPQPRRGPWCDTPGVSFVLRREIYPNLGCSVKISISRSCLSLFIRLSLGSSPNSELFDLEKQPISERVKTFISRNECRLEDHS
jgi:hypothetical protein